MDIVKELEKLGLCPTIDNIELLLKKEKEKKKKEDIKEIKSLLDKGMSKKDVLMLCKYSYDVLKEAGVGLTALIPTNEPQNVINDWDYSIPNEGKFEYFDNICFGDALGRDSLTLCLLANMGLEHFVEILPEESKKILRDILKK